jgi:trigger factor
MVQIKLTETILNPEENQDPNLAEDMTQSVYVNKEYDHKDTLPYQGFMDQLIGMNVGDEKTVTHTFNEVEPDDALFEKEVDLKFSIVAISTAVLPDLTDEFAQSVSTEYATVDDLRKSIGEQIETYRKQNYDNEYLTALMDEIVSQSPVKYPPQLFDQEVEAYLEQTEHELSHQGMEFDAYLKVLGKTKEEFVEDHKEEIETKIHRVLVLEEISRRENLQVNQQELQQSVAEMTMRYGLYQYMKQLPKQQADRIAQRITMDAANQILNDKLMKRLIYIGSGQMELEAELRSLDSMTEEDSIVATESETETAEPVE